MSITYNYDVAKKSLRVNDLLPWIHIFLAIFAYILIALLASVTTRKIDGNLKEMKERSSPRVLVVGAIANLCVLATTLMLLRFLDGRPVSALGFSFSSQDLIFTIVSIAAIFALAVAFIGFLRRTGRCQVEMHSPVKDMAGTWAMIAGLTVLLIVAIQEEVLFRGYITLNLLSYGPVVIIIVSTILFVAIHLLTNRTNFYQIVSWFLGGAVFAYAYLISGSIWVPIMLHFATDTINMVVFDIVGQYSLFTISPSLGERRRAAYRATYAVVLVVAFIVFYGLHIKIG